MFGWFRKKSPRSRPNPMSTYDTVIASFERQAAEVRKSAATLLALRGALSAELDGYATQLAQLDARLAEAQRSGDALVAGAFTRDVTQVRQRQAQAEASLATAKLDAQLLLDAAERVQTTLNELKAERASAQTRMAVGQLVSTALAARAEEFERLVKLDAARDEVERAHALAELYRTDSK